MARSPNYPAISLKEAVDRVKAIYDSERRAAMTAEVAAEALGYTALHGPARRKLAALRSFGLLDGRGDSLRVSELAMTILYATSPAEKAEAIREAALRPELFKDLADQPGASDGNLVSVLIRRGFIPEGARKAVASFRETMSLASSDEDAYDPDESEDQDVLDTTPKSGDKIDLRFRGRVGGRNTFHDLVFIWPLPDGVVAQVEIKNGPLSARGLDMLKRYLDMARETMPDEAEIGAPSPPSEPEPLSEQSRTDAQD